MKILWFTNTPCCAAEKLCPNLVIGGWLSSLENQLIQFENIELHICFYWTKRITPFHYKRTRYYPVLTSGGSSKLKRTISRAFGKNETDEKDAASLLQIIKIVNPDIIHIHGTESNFGMIQKHTNIPVVVSLQGIVTVYQEKLFSGIPLEKVKRYEGFLSKVTFKSAGSIHKLMGKTGKREREILSFTKNIIGRTDWDRRVSSVLAPKAKYFIGNEILREAFYKRKWNKGSFDTPLRIVTTMSWVLYKGLETIVKAAKILCENEAISFTWTVIGLNEKGNIPKIVRKWLRIDYNRLNVQLVGLKSESDLVDILCSSDIYCQVSHIENSPNSVCEAMLVGIPIIASAAGGTDSILENGKEGILIQDGDPYSLAGTIIEMAKNYDKAQFYSINAFNTAQMRHDKYEITKSLIDVYKKCLSD